MTATGRMLAGRYRLFDEVGHGGMAVVYRGHDEVLDRDVAIKLLRPAYATDEDFVARFRREARHAAALHHPNIVTIYDRGIDPGSGTDYIVMQLIDGPDLDRLLAAEGRLPLEQALRIGVETTRALQAAHDHGIVHRDVKPGNILIDRDGSARVADFGIARAVSENSATTTGVILASPQYASPEQVLGERITPASDVYSLGVVLYDAITGQRPFDGPSPAAVALERLRVRPAPPSAVAHDLPPAVDRIILRALERESEDRYASAADMGADLEEVRLRALGGIRRSGALVRGLIGDVSVAAAAAGAAASAAGAAATSGPARPSGRAASKASASQPSPPTRTPIPAEGQNAATPKQDRDEDTVAIAIPAAAIAAASGAAAVAGAALDGATRPRSPGPVAGTTFAGSPAASAMSTAAVPAGAAIPASGATSAIAPNTTPAAASAAPPTAAAAETADPRLTDASPRAVAQRRRRRAAPFALLALALGCLAAVLLGIGLLSGSADRTGLPGALPSDDLTAIGLAPTPTPPTPTPSSTPSLLPAVVASPSPTASPTATPTPTPVPTRIATLQPTPTPAPPRVAPSAPSRDPAETVTRFYALVEQHRFSEAAGLWSARMKSRYPPSQYIDDRFAATTRIDIDRISTRSMSVANGTANVFVALTEYRTSGPIQHWVGSWDMVLTSSGWLMDRPHF